MEYAKCLATLYDHNQHMSLINKIAVLVEMFKNDILKHIAIEEMNQLIATLISSGNVSALTVLKDALYEIGHDLSHMSESYNNFKDTFYDLKTCRILNIRLARR
jgi:hypothetical protein